MSDHTKQPTIVRATATQQTPQPPSSISPPEVWKLPLILPVAYLSFVPIAEYAARLRIFTPILNVIMSPLMWGLSGFDSNYPRGGVDGRQVIALSLFYVVAVWIASLILSVMGQTMGGPGSYDLKTPRLGKASLTGLPHRLTAIHQNMLECFPLFAIAAVFTQMIAPLDPHLIELLSLHIFTKTFLYPSFYAAGMNQYRSLSYSLSVGACLRVLSIIALKV